MNQGRVWCVVNPSVGLPLLLGSVAITSFIVHASVMTHTTWMASYWSGSWRNRTAVNEGPAANVADATARVAPGFSIAVTPVAGAAGRNETSFVVSVTPNAGASVEVPAPRPPGPLAAATPQAE